jgi:hypothetical protein
MKNLLAISLFTALLLTAQSAPAPVALPPPTALDPGEQLDASREQTAEMQAETDLARAQFAVVQARAKYAAVIEALRAKHGAAAGCDLTTGQTWTCTK